MANIISIQEDGTLGNMVLHTEHPELHMKNFTDKVVVEFSEEEYGMMKSSKDILEQAKPLIKDGTLVLKMQAVIDEYVANETATAANLAAYEAARSAEIASLTAEQSITFQKTGKLPSEIQAEELNQLYASLTPEEQAVYDETGQLPATK